VLVRVEACGLCRTDLHIVDGELPEQKRPVVLGHQVVGVVEEVGEGVMQPARGARVGVPWLSRTCGACRYCLEGNENLCDQARFTGYHVDGGLAEFAVAAADFTFPIPAGYAAREAAPLLCAGLIGFRALRMAGPAHCLGLYGFGAAAHIAVQIARHRGARVFAFTRTGDARSQRFAQEFGCSWVGSSETAPPEPLDAAILFAPVGNLVPLALRAVRKGGTVVCAGIHMSDIPSFPYVDLWGERVLRSVANLTRRDGEEFFLAAVAAGVRTRVLEYSLEAAGGALEDLRHGRYQGAGVVVPTG
jgi:propanol-preferring alcohol dehydrogenase